MNKEQKGFKVTDKNDTKEIPVELKENMLKVVPEESSESNQFESGEIKAIKASERTRSHLNSPGATNRTFGTMEEMVSSANSIYTNVNVEEHEKDKKNGFDINDIESIKAFRAGYTPVGNSVLIKVIKEEQKIGNIIIPPGSGDSIKAVVVVPGLYVNNLKVGDIITFKLAQGGKVQLPPMVDNTIKGIKFKEVSYEAILGVFIERETIIDRIAEENIKLKAN